MSDANPNDVATALEDYSTGMWNGLTSAEVRDAADLIRSQSVTIERLRAVIDGVQRIAENNGHSGRSGDALDAIAQMARKTLEDS